jgi:hypothetical protein
MRPEIKILMMTGYTDAGVCDEIRAAGLQLLSKPFSRRVLASKIREMLDAASAPSIGPMSAETRDNKAKVYIA